MVYRQVLNCFLTNVTSTFLSYSKSGKSNSENRCTKASDPIPTTREGPGSGHAVRLGPKRFQLFSGKADIPKVVVEQHTLMVKTNTLELWKVEGIFYKQR